MIGTKRGTLLGVLALGGGLLLSACATTGNSAIRFAFGSDGLILASTDGGSSWSPQASHTGNDLYGASFNGTTNGCAVGKASTVVVTTDGSTWSKVSGVPSGSNLRAIDVWPGSPTVVSSAAAVPLNGTTTVTSTIITTTGSNNSFGYAVGENGRILGTLDSCQHWTKLTSGTTDDLMGVSLHVPNSLEAWAVGQHGTILHTTDGVTWTPQVSGTTHDLRAIRMLAGFGWAVGEHGVIVFTSNGGNTWTPENSGVTTRLNSIGTSEGGVYVVGENGVILTLTGPSIWAQQVSGTTRELRSVSSVSGSDGVIVGDHGTVLVTSNGGSTWTPHSSGTTKTLRGSV